MEPLNLYSQIRDFARNHALWLLGLVPFAIAALKIFTISAGDLEVFGYLVQHLDLIGLVLSITLPLIPVLVFWVWVMWWDRRRLTPKANRSDLGGWKYPLTTVIGFSIIYMQTGYVVTSIVVLSYIVIGRLRLPKRNERELLRYGIDNKLLWRSPPIDAVSLLIVIAVQALISVNTHWIPTEIITIKDQPPQLARVAEVNEVFITYLDDRNRIALVRSPDVLSREPCQQGSARRSPTGTLTTFMFGEPTDTKCPERREN